jgi:hypothetical protein
MIDKMIDNFVSSVSIITVQDIHLISSKSQIPIKIRNSLSKNVLINLYLYSGTNSIKIVPSRANSNIAVEANSEKIVQVAVESVGGGQTPITASIYTSNGGNVVSTREFNVVSYLQIGISGTVLFVAIILFLVVCGVYRMRNRKNRKNDE